MRGPQDGCSLTTSPSNHPHAIFETEAFVDHLIKITIICRNCEDTEMGSTAQRPDGFDIAMMLRREQEIKSTAQRPDDFHIVSGQAPVYRVVEYPIALQLRGGRMMRLIKMRLKLG